MILTFRAGEQFGDIVAAESPAQSHRPRIRAIGPGGRGIQDRIEPDPQGGVDHFLERLAELFGAPLRFGGNIRVKRQCCSHTSMMMPSKGVSRCRIGSSYTPGCANCAQAMSPKHLSRGQRLSCMRAARPLYCKHEFRFIRDEGIS